MLRLAADENFNKDIVRGVQRRVRDLDIVRVQEAGLSGAGDPAVLEWAAREGRILLTHDVATMGRHAYDRIKSGLPMAGMLVIAQTMPVVSVMDDVILVAGASLDGEWEGQVRYLPL